MLLGACCFYNILGALQTDVDGSVLPLCFLIALIAYDKILVRLKASETDQTQRIKVNGWIVVFIIALLAGMLTKLSFVLVVAVFALDYIWENRSNHPGTYLGRSIGLGVIFAGLYVAVLYLIQVVYPAFSISFMLTHAHQFTSTSGRGWTQIIVQGVKALYYLSPLVIAPLFWISRGTLKKARPFLIYLILGCLFYFVLFDFSQGALDKYLMFATVPLVALAGMSIAELLRNLNAKFLQTGISHSFSKVFIIGILPGLALAALVFWTNFFHPAVVALYPKSEWFGRVIHGHWNILTPITGGSGPMGFYISFLFIAVSFIIAIVAAIVGRLAMNGRFGEKNFIWLIPMFCVVCATGFTYNAVFAEEYMFGTINGSSAKVLAADIQFIRESKLVKKALTYNDAGAGPLSELNVYAGRIYATPEAEEMYRAKFAAFDGHYLVVDVPRLYADGFYAKFFATCTILYQSVSKQISGTLYRCPKP
jgi:hypothetical protein